MTLPMRDRRALAEIEQHFLEDDPELALLLGTFGGAGTGGRRTGLVRRLRTGVVIAYLAVIVSGALFVAGAVARDAGLLMASGAMVLVSGLPWVCARFRRRAERPAEPDLRRGGHATR
ncbi:DUF3040 domain-containing protein [Streptomyces sp. NPDC056149]|uniref:DUF3040 domain-containing protein n=1 Tax=unclassified Streptomyces TaxID=2593676 RepID=UPI0023818210|nr:DUF3040 domain-containing protein [Streptomyces sp. WZ-12]